MGQQFQSKDFESWVPAQQALARYRAVAQTYAASDLIKRLAAGLLAARAENFIVTFAQPKKYGPEMLLPAYVWKAIADHAPSEGLSLWITGSAEADIFPDGTDANPVPHKLFGVRFHPAQVEKLTSPIPSGERPEKQPIVPRPALRAWYEAYRLAYPEQERTADHAWVSAKGAFPGKAVPRALVRELLPPGKPGPKGRRVTRREFRHVRPDSPGFPG